MVWLFTVAALAQDVDADGFSVPAGDCNDFNANIHPGAPESAGDNVDQDCNGVEDCYFDADNDGTRSLVVDVGGANNDADCNDAFEGLVTDPLDCDEGSPAVRPGAAEIAGDGVDQNCDGVENCYTDADDDDGRSSTVDVGGANDDADCSDAFEGITTDPIDCDDADPLVAPNSIEVCGAVAPDCNGHVEPFVGDLADPVPGVAAAANQWDLTGGPALADYVVVAGIAGSGLTTVPGCPDVDLPVAVPRFIGVGITDAAGAGSEVRFLPAAASGQDVYAVAVFPATCETSCLRLTAFP